MTNDKFFQGATVIFKLLIVIIVLAGSAAAQSPVMPSQERDAEKDALYGTFSGAKVNPTAEQQRRAYEAAREYLRKFAEDKDPEVAEVKAYVAKYEKVMREQDLYKSYTAKRYEDVFKLGGEIIDKEPDNFFVLGILAEAGLDHARAGKTNFNSQTTDYLRAAIRLLDAKVVTAPRPFETIEFAKGYLNAGLGSLLKDKSHDEAATAFWKAAKSDSSFHNDPIIYHRLGTAILKGEFAQLSAEYNQKYTNQPSSPAQQAMMGRLSKLMLRVIDAYARAVALSKTPAQQETRTKILEQLTSLYKIYYGSETGLNELIAGVLSKPIPEEQ